MSEPTEEVELDLKLIDRSRLPEVLSKASAAEHAVALIHPERCDFLLPSLAATAKLRVAGDLGDYCFLANQGAQLEVEGEVGHACGQAQRSGNIVVHGSAGPCLGSFLAGGWVAVYGSAGARCGAGLSHGEVIVRGSVGAEAAFEMRGGTLVVGGSAGANLGTGMSGGVIFVRGDVESVGDHIEEFRLKEADRFRLGLLMLKAGIKAIGKDFRGFRRIPS